MTSFSLIDVAITRFPPAESPTKKILLPVVPRTIEHINCINCKVFDFNSSVISLHQKFGFEKIGLEKINKDNLISFMLSKKNWTKKIPAIKAKLRV